VAQFKQPHQTRKGCTKLVMADGQAEGLDDGSRLAFNWRESDRRYRRAPKADKPAH
jgi:hypothetical protein